MDQIAAVYLFEDGAGPIVEDAIYTLEFNFLGGPPPPAPLPSCGPGERSTDTDLGCLSSAGCSR